MSVGKLHHLPLLQLPQLYDGAAATLRFERVIGNKQVTTHIALMIGSGGHGVICDDSLLFHRHSLLWPGWEGTHPTVSETEASLVSGGRLFFKLSKVIFSFIRFRSKAF